MATNEGFVDGKKGEADEDGFSIDEYREYQEELGQRFLESVSSD